MDNQKDRQMHSWTVCLMDFWTDIWINGLVVGHKDCLMCSQTASGTYSQMNKMNDQTDSQMDGWTVRRMDCWIEIWINGRMVVNTDCLMYGQTDTGTYS